MVEGINVKLKYLIFKYMADWEKIQEEFISWRFNEKTKSMSSIDIFNWFKSRLESEYPPIEKLSEEEKNEFYVTNVTADIKANYGK